MKTLLDREVTISFSFRPFRALRNLAVAAAFLFVLALPVPVGIASDIKREPTVAEQSRDTALKVVSDIINERMAYLDRDRRVMLANTIVDESLACGIDPLFSLAVGDVESRLDHEAVSPTGARGMFQVIPSTWKAEVKRRGLGPLEKFNVVHNAKVGIGYLCYLSKSFRRPDSFLLAYNQGPKTALAVFRNNEPMNEEGAGYAPRVWASYKRFLGAVKLPTDLRSMRTLAKAPEKSIYVPTLASNEYKPPPPAPPRKAKAQPKPPMLVAGNP